MKFYVSFFCHIILSPSIYCLFFVCYLNCSQVVFSQEVIHFTQLEFENCIPQAEICGSGIDENCDSIDASCSGNDKDRDGFPSSQDCDDSNRFIYPGISVACEASCGKGHRICQSNGSYSNCICTPLCEAQNANCYYVDPVSGSNNGTGTFSNRVNSLNRLLEIVNLAAGDYVYLFSGLYDSGLGRQLVISNIQASNNAMLVFKNYPSEKPIFRSETLSPGITIFQSRGIMLDGIIIDSPFHFGISIDSSRDITIRNSIIRGVKILDNNSASLIINNSSSVIIDNMIFYNVFSNV